VPQGSVLGQLLFSLYVAPIADIVNEFDLGKMFYADDSQLYVTINPKDNTDSSLTRLENCIARIKIWMQQNMLKLNDNKTEVVLFGSPHFMRQSSGISIHVGESEIMSVKSVRNLGAFFDECMSMDDFVKAKGSSIQGQLRKIYRIRRYLTVEACKSITQALIISRLDYCSSLLLNTKQYNIKYLQRLQDSAARLIYRAHHRENACILRRNLHWLPVKERVIFRNLTYVFKCLNSEAPTYLTELLEHYKEGRQTRSSTKCLRLVEPFTKTEMEKRAFSVSVPALWNKLCDNIKMSINVVSFKKLLKTHLFKVVYNI